MFVLETSTKFRQLFRQSLMLSTATISTASAALDRDSGFGDAKRLQVNQDLLLEGQRGK